MRPTPDKSIDIENFARRVERVCDFLIDKYSEKAGRDGSDDLKVLEDLKNDAADIQAGFTTVDIPLVGLADAVRTT